MHKAVQHTALAKLEIALPASSQFAIVIVEVVALITFPILLKNNPFSRTMLALVAVMRA